MILSIGLLKGLFPATPEATLSLYLKPLNDHLNQYGINQPKRMAAFLANIGHETAGFRATAENLNYSAQALRKLWPTHFQTDAIANAYARQPQRIANRAYANRMGNGDEASGDGWRYRGQGALQLTGKTNYQAFATWAHLSLDEATVAMGTPDGAILSAVYFWTVHGLNKLADAGNIDAVRKAVNGGTIGLDDVRSLYGRILSTVS